MPVWSTPCSPRYHLNTLECTLVYSFVLSLRVVALPLCVVCPLPCPVWVYRGACRLCLACGVGTAARYYTPCYSALHNAPLFSCPYTWCYMACFLQCPISNLIKNRVIKSTLFHGSYISAFISCFRFSIHAHNLGILLFHLCLLIHQELLLLHLQSHRLLLHVQCLAFYPCTLC